jgi:DNA-binding transcriptional MerR regulator
MYKIGEFSWLSQVPIRTLRYYDQIGLLVPAHVERPSGYRCYAADQLEQLNRILVYKDLGLSLREIRALLAERASADDIRELVRRKRAELEHRVETERRRLDRAAARLALMERSATFPEVAVRHAAPAWIASIRATLRSYDDCDQLFGELDRQVRGPRARQRGAIYHACEPGTVDCEAFEIIPERVAARGRVAVRQLPADRGAAIDQRGDADYLPAYRAIRAWIDMAGFAVTGPKRELFLRGAGSVTEIQFPIGRAANHRARDHAPAHPASPSASPELGSPR